MYVQLRENLRITRLVWLFLFINVYWWSNSTPTNVIKPTDVTRSVDIYGGESFYALYVFVAIIFYSIINTFLNRTASNPISFDYFKQLIFGQQSDARQINPNSYAYILLICLTLLFFYLKFYLFCVYCIVAIVYFRYFTTMQSYTKEGVLIEHQNLDKTEYNLEFNNYTLGFLLLVGVVGFFYGIIIAKFYLAFVIFSILLRIFGLKMSETFPSIIKWVNQVRKDNLTIKYHWYESFHLLRSFIHISLISLILSVIFMLMVGVVVEVSSETKDLNVNLWLVSALLHIIVAVSTDLYIIYFKNITIRQQFVAACQRCALYATGGYFIWEQTVEQNLVAKNNSVSNFARYVTGNPTITDKTQYYQNRIILKYLPEYKIQDYTTSGDMGERKFNSTKFFSIISNEREVLRKVFSRMTPDEVASLNLPLKGLLFGHSTGPNDTEAFNKAFPKNESFDLPKQPNKLSSLNPNNAFDQDSGSSKKLVRQNSEPIITNTPKPSNLPRRNTG